MCVFTSEVKILYIDGVTYLYRFLAAGNMYYVYWNIDNSGVNINNLQKGTKAPQAAGKIHTDFEKGFIMAEVMKFADFKEEGSEASVKAAGKYRQQGRNYVVEDGDIIFFKFNAGAGLKDAKKKWLRAVVLIMVYLYLNMILFFSSIACWTAIHRFRLFCFCIQIRILWTENNIYK